MNLSYPLLALSGIAASSFILALSWALMPGPLLTLTVLDAAHRGTRSGPLVITGHVVSELLLVTTIFFGLEPILLAPLVICISSFCGGIILLFMGVEMIRKAPTLSLRQELPQDTRNQPSNPVLLGFVGSLANPDWIIWWVTIGFAFLTMADRFGTSGIIAFFLGHITADYGWYIMVDPGASRNKSIVEQRHRLLVRVCGLFLICFGGWFLNSAYQYLGGETGRKFLSAL